MAMPTRTLLLTGASRGIGLAIAHRLLEDGHKVIGLARNFSNSAVRDHARFAAETVDLADPATLPAFLQALLRRYPDIDGAILNAGQGRFGSLEELSCAQIGALMDLNFTAQACVTRALLPGLKRRNGGDLLFIGSEAALWGGKRGAVYAASKAALRAFARALREECARSGVRIGVINPGMVRTEFYDDQPFAPGAAPENAIEPEDVAAAVALMLDYRSGVVVDELNMTPLKKVLKLAGHPE